MASIDPVTSESGCNNRTVVGIIFSCLATIALCIWASIHPNVPDGDDTMFVNIFRRLKLAMFALIAPELVIAWAVRQQFVARNLVRAYRKDHGWTMVHGFFLCMGGFTIIRDDGSHLPLTPDHFEILLENDEIDFPTTSRAEIEDKSKGDIFSKAFAIGQTLWFILQVIVRGVIRLPITELELVTVAYSLLNLFTYVLWLGKPLHVQRGIVIPLKVAFSTQQDRMSRSREPTTGASGMYFAIAMINRISEPIVRFIQTVNRLDIPKKGISSAIVRSVWFVIKNGVLLPIPKLILGGYNMGLSDPSSHTRVPTFYAADITGFQTICMGLATTVVASGFGGIHCIAWSFSFPTHIEKILWRTSSVVITVVPVFYLLFFGFVSFCLGRSLTLPPQLRGLLENLFRIVVLFFTFVYVIARVALLILPFTSLRSLLHDEFKTISWIVLIPHVQ